MSLYSFQASPPSGKLSKEEQLLSERKRCVSYGMTDFELHAESGKFVLPVSGSLFGCVDHAGGSCHHGHRETVTVPPQSPLFPFELKTECAGVRYNPTICPANPVRGAGVRCILSSLPAHFRTWWPSCPIGTST